MGVNRILITIIACYALAIVVRLAAPSDIDNRDQAKQGLYVLDVVQGKSFILPRELGTRFSTKPPLYTWIAAGISSIFGGVTDLTIRLPAVLSGLGVVLITLSLGEMVFSRQVGFFASLILMANVPFLDLSATARTDMMLTFFVTLSLFFFLKGYRQGRPLFSVLAFFSMGLGSLTKGPVAFVLPSIVIVVFLTSVRDLKWLKSMRLGRGIAIGLFVVLLWFIPALMMGGREYFDLVVMDEMINRFFGMGTRAEKAKPFYYLIGLFFVRFLPWSLFVPTALAKFWRDKNGSESGSQKGVFPCVWFLTVMVFFSVSRGKRADYLLPLYPAASILVAHLWVSLMNLGVDRWKAQVRAITSGWFLFNAGLSVVLAALIMNLNPFSTGQLASKGLEVIDSIYRSIGRSSSLLILIGFPLALASILGIGLLRRGNLKGLFICMLAVSALNVFLYFEFFSPRAIDLSGQRKKAFCLRVAGQINSADDLRFFNVESSLPFYLGKNERPLNPNEVSEFFLAARASYLVTTEADYLAIRDRVHFQFALLEQSEYLPQEKVKYVLLGGRKRAEGEDAH